MRCPVIIFKGHFITFFIIAFLANLPLLTGLRAQERVLISYGGFNETVGPMWVAVDKGLFKKYGLDVSCFRFATARSAWLL